MKFEIFVARRYLTKGKKYSFISTISIVSTIGIAIGVAALIIALSLINGFQKDIRDKILSSTPHIMISGPEGIPLADDSLLVERIRVFHHQVVGAEPVVVGTVLLKGVSMDSSGVLLQGVSFAEPRRESWLQKVERGRLPVDNHQLLIGEKIASSIGALEGQQVNVIAPRSTFIKKGGQPQVKKATISGIFKSGLYELDNGVAISNLVTAQDLLGLNGKISFIQVSLEDIFSAEAVASQLRDKLGKDYTLKTWQELKAPLYSALKMEKDVLFFTLTLIIVVASLNIIAGLILLVIQKIKDIGILLSYGATPKTIQRIFFIQGGIIGLLGTSLGFLLGLVFCFLANRFQLIKIPTDFYQMSFVPFNVEGLDVAMVAIVALAICFISTMIPAKKAGAIDVVDAIKSE